MIKIADIIDKPNAILHTDGNKVYNAIIESIQESKVMVISFDGITHCTTSFLNASIGKIWMNMPESKNLFLFEEITPALSEKIQLVKENALNSQKRNNWESAAREYIEHAF
jgi:threonine aldolase